MNNLIQAGNSYADLIEKYDSAKAFYAKMRHLLAKTKSRADNLLKIAAIKFKGSTLVTMTIRLHFNCIFNIALNRHISVRANVYITCTYYVLYIYIHCRNKNVVMMNCDEISLVSCTFVI